VLGNTNAHTDSHAYPDAHAYADSYTYAYPNPNAYTCARNGNGERVTHADY
jgi:hypothetical protein